MIIFSGLLKLFHLGFMEKGNPGHGAVNIGKEGQAHEKERQDYRKEFILRVKTAKRIGRTENNGCK